MDKIFKEHKAKVIFIALGLSFSIVSIALFVDSSFLEDQGIDKKALARCIKQIQITRTELNERVAEESAKRMVREENYCEFSNLSSFKNYLSLCRDPFYIITTKEYSYLFKQINEC